MNVLLFKQDLDRYSNADIQTLAKFYEINADPKDLRWLIALRHADKRQMTAQQRFAHARGIVDKIISGDATEEDMEYADIWLDLSKNPRAIEHAKKVIEKIKSGTATEKEMLYSHLWEKILKKSAQMYRGSKPLTPSERAKRRFAHAKEIADRVLSGEATEEEMEYADIWLDLSKDPRAIKQAKKLSKK